MIATATLVVAACAVDTNADGGEAILLSAASDLASVIPALATAFQQESGVKLNTTVGASGMLAQQILNGAPVDVFASADVSWVDRLVAAGRALPDTRATYARGQLAIVVAPQLRGRALAVTDLADPRFRRIAIAHPDVAPYGRAARDALRAAGIWEAIEPRVVIGENVRQTLEYVMTGNVDAAVVARALVPRDTPFDTVPPDLYTPLEQDVIVMRGSAHDAAARRFVEFLTGDIGRAILRSHNFTVPDRSP